MISAKYLEIVTKGILGLFVSISILTTTGIVLILFSESFKFFQEVSVFDFLFGTRWAPMLNPQSFGVLPLVCGTFSIMVGAGLVAIPLGLISAIYLSEYASKNIRNVIKPILEVLAGIPTIVYGYFALTFITPILKSIFPEISVFNALSGALVVGIMILPMISSLCDDAFRAVPKEVKYGAYALSASTFEVIFGVIIPHAKSRVMSSVVLALSRAIGETMAVTLAAGASPNMTLNPLDAIQTMTAFIVQVSLGDTPAGGIEYQTSFAIGVLLFIITLLLNLLGQRLIK